jgi:hypothetical protein
MDTFKDRQNIQSLFELGQRPWAVWEPVAEGPLPFPGTAL